jgi:hypothetical protein
MVVLGGRSLCIRGTPNQNRWEAEKAGPIKRAGLFICFGLHSGFHFFFDTIAARPRNTPKLTALFGQSRAAPTLGKAAAQLFTIQNNRGD